MEKVESKETIYSSKTVNKSKELTITKKDGVTFGYYLDNFTGSVSLSDLIIMRDFMSDVIKDNQL
jgi:polysaccharide deacetylase 2 family uncharacterized protein YibQ